MAFANVKALSTRQTPQSEPIPNKPMVANSAGGFAFAVDDWTRLDRFLILGNEGTYYASEQKLTVENAECVKRCVLADPKRTVDRIAEISLAGRAPKNSPAILALAVCASTSLPLVNAVALSRLGDVCRIGTHLFEFVSIVQELRGWGPALCKAVQRWYLDMPARDMAHQCAKYQQREGWSHKNVMHLSHLRAIGTHKEVQYWCEKGWESVGDETHPNADLGILWAMERLKRTPSVDVACKLIREYNLSREMLPTELLTHKAVWLALLERMPITAMIRNLATMTRIGVIGPMSSDNAKVIAKMSTENLRKGRVHPIQVLSALLTYAQGHGERGQNTWQPEQSIVNALDSAFYASFQAVEPTGKRWLLACDVSGSMDGGTIAGVPGLTPRLGTAAFALTIANTEPTHHMVAFTANGYSNHATGRGRWQSSHGIGNGISPLPISPQQRLDDAIKTMASLPMGGTDCALPMLYAADNKIPTDVFVVLTDNETWAGAIHPCQALQQYRQKMNINAKLIVVGMTATGFTIADPADSGMLDVVGFDAAAPAVMADFAKN